MYPPYITRTSRLITSGKGISRLKIFGLEDIFSIDTSDELTNIPLEIFLEYTFTIDAEIITQSVQSALGGSCLPTPIKNGHVVIRNLSDLIAVKTNNRDTSFGIKVNRSICRLPVLIRLNSSTHLLFDLTHVWWVSEVKWGVVPHASKLHGIGVYGKNSGQLVECHTISLYWTNGDSSSSSCW